MSNAFSKYGPKVGLAAVVLFAPGGFILGAGLAARWWRQRASRSVNG